MENKNNQNVFKTAEVHENKSIKNSLNDLKNDMEKLNENFSKYLLSCWKDFDETNEGINEQTERSDLITNFFTNFDKKYNNTEKDNQINSSNINKDILIDNSTVKFIKSEVEKDVFNLSEGIDRLKNYIKIKSKEINEIADNFNNHK